MSGGPGEALARWQGLAAADGEDPVACVRGWIERLGARMQATGGRLGRLLVEAELCELEEIVACARAQLAAGPIGANALRYDVELDVDVVAALGSIEEVAELSATIDAQEWPDCADSLHVALAERLLAAGRAGEIEGVLGRVAWHRPLLGWLEAHADSLEPGLRARLFARAGRLVEATHLPAEYHVELFVQLAVLMRARSWLARAEAVLAGLPAEQRAATPDHEHPVVSIARGLAQLGDVVGGLARLDGLDGVDRWWGLAQLLEFADPERRAGIVEAMIAGVGPLELEWAWLVEQAPEAGPRALAAIEAMPEGEARIEALLGVARWLRGAPARRACAELLAHAGGLAPGSKAWIRLWEELPDALARSEQAGLLGAATRRALIDELLARPEIDLWAELGPFVPDDRVEAVLERSYAELERADHYRGREAWIEVGARVLPRAPSASAGRWLALAARAKVGTSFDGGGIEQLALWSAELRREIVLERLAQHRREFMPGQLVTPWLLWLGWSLPGRVCPDWGAWIGAEALARQRAHALEFEVVAACDPAERAALMRTLVAWTGTSRWPEHEEVQWVFALLGRLAGEEGLRAGLAALVELRARLAA